MIKLIIQKKKRKKKPTSIATSKSSVCFIKVLELFLWHPILVLVLGIPGFVGKHAALLLDTLGWR
jgi:hypothetical protein